MPKRSYRKKSGRKSGKKASRKGSKKSYRKKGSKKSRKASKKSKRRRTIRKTRKASPCKDLDEAECGYNPSCEYKTNRYGTKYCKSRAGTLYKRKLSNKLTKVQGPMGPPEGYVPKEEKKELDKAEAVLDKKEEKLEDAIVAGAPAPVIAELKEEVKDAKEKVEEKLEKLEEVAKEVFEYGGDLEFNLPALGFRIRKRVKGSKRGKKSRGKKSRGKSRKISRGKKSRGKKSRGKKSRRNSGFRSRHMM